MHKCTKNFNIPICVWEEPENEDIFEIGTWGPPQVCLIVRKMKS